MNKIIHDWLNSTTVKCLLVWFVSEHKRECDSEARINLNKCGSSSIDSFRENYETTHKKSPQSNWETFHFCYTVKSVSAALIKSVLSLWKMCGEKWELSFTRILVQLTWGPLTVGNWVNKHAVYVHIIGGVSIRPDGCKSAASFNGEVIHNWKQLFVGVMNSLGISVCRTQLDSYPIVQASPEM